MEEPIFDHTRMIPADHDTWLIPNDHASYLFPHLLLKDTYSATTILLFKRIRYHDCQEIYHPYGLAYNISVGILPSLEFSFCPVLHTRSSLSRFEKCDTGQNYSTASFSYVPERIND